MGGETIPGLLGEVGGVEIVRGGGVVVAGGDGVDGCGLEGTVESEDTGGGPPAEGLVDLLAVLLDDMERNEVEGLVVNKAVDAQVAGFGPVPVAEAAVGDIVGDDITVAVDVADAEDVGGADGLGRVGCTGELNSYQTNVQYLTAQIFVYLFLHSFKFLFNVTQKSQKTQKGCI